MINCLTQIIGKMLTDAINGNDPEQEINEIIHNIDDDDVLMSFVAHDNWIVRASVAKYVSGRSYEQLLALERDEDERVRNAAVERHASDLACLASMYAKRDLKSKKKHGIWA